MTTFKPALLLSISCLIAPHAGFAAQTPASKSHAKTKHNKAWVLVLHVEGDGNKTTDPFTIPSGGKYWRVNYSCQQMSSGDLSVDGNFAVELKKPGDDFDKLLVNTMGAKSGATNVYEKGTFYLDVEGDEPFIVDVYAWK